MGSADPAARGRNLGPSQRYQRAYQLLDEAQALIEPLDQRFYEAELHRVRGLIMIAEAPDPQAGAANLDRAIDVARRQNARFLELRADGEQGAAASRSRSAATMRAICWCPSSPHSARDLIRPISVKHVLCSTRVDRDVNDQIWCMLRCCYHVITTQ